MSATYSEALAAAAAPIERIRFDAGGLGLLCPQASARELTPLAPIARAPNTPEWVCGLMNVRGAPVPVIDLAGAFGAAPTVPAYALVFAHEESAVGILVDDLPAWCTVAPANRLSRAPACPDMLRAHVHDAYYEGDRVWFDIDIHGLLRALSRALT